MQGERFSVRTPLEDSIPSEENPRPRDASGPAASERRAISLGAASGNSEWAQRGGNARHAAGHVALSAQPQPLWAVSIGKGAGKRDRIAAAPVVAGGRVFALDAASQVSAVTPSGGLLWQTSVASPHDRGVAPSGGGLAADGGRLFVSTASGELLALDAASGGIIWRQRVDAPLQGAPAVEGGIVYVASRDGGAWAVDAKDGKVVWHVVGTPATTGVVGTAAPTVADRVVVFPSGAGDLMAVLKQGGGTKVWQESLAGQRAGRAYGFNQDVTGDAVLAGGVLYTGTAAGRTAALDAGSGQKIWTSGEGAMGPVVVAGGSVFLVNDEARLVRLDAASGQTIWNVEMPYFEATKIKKRKAITAHYGPVLAGGRLWVASSDGILRGFEPEGGSLVHQTEIKGGAATQPAVAGGILYVVSNNGQLLAFR